MVIDLLMETGIDKVRRVYEVVDNVSPSYGSLDRDDELIKEEMSHRFGWYDIPKDGGGDIDLADF